MSRRPFLATASTLLALLSVAGPGATALRAQSDPSMSDLDDTDWRQRNATARQLAERSPTFEDLDEVATRIERIDCPPWKSTGGRFGGRSGYRDTLYQRLRDCTDRLYWNAFRRDIYLPDLRYGVVLRGAEQLCVAWEPAELALFVAATWSARGDAAAAQDRLIAAARRLLVAPHHETNRNNAAHAAHLLWCAGDAGSAVLEELLASDGDDAPLTTIYQGIAGHGPKARDFLHDLAMTGKVLRRDNALRAVQEFARGDPERNARRAELFGALCTGRAAPTFAKECSDDELDRLCSALCETGDTELRHALMQALECALDPSRDDTPTMRELPGMTRALLADDFRRQPHSLSAHALWTSHPGSRPPERTLSTLAHAFGGGPASFDDLSGRPKATVTPLYARARERSDDWLDDEAPDHDYDGRARRMTTWILLAVGRCEAGEPQGTALSDTATSLLQHGLASEDDFERYVAATAVAMIGPRAATLEPWLHTRGWFPDAQLEHRLAYARDRIAWTRERRSEEFARLTLADGWPALEQRLEAFRRVDVFDERADGGIAEDVAFHLLDLAEGSGHAELSAWAVENLPRNEATIERLRALDHEGSIDLFDEVLFASPKRLVEIVGQLADRDREHLEDHSTSLQLLLPTLSDRAPDLIDAWRPAVRRLAETEGAPIDLRVRAAMSLHWSYRPEPPPADLVTLTEKLFDTTDDPELRGHLARLILASSQD